MNFSAALLIIFAAFIVPAFAKVDVRLTHCQVSEIKDQPDRIEFLVSSVGTILLKDKSGNNQYMPTVFNNTRIIISKSFFGKVESGSGLTWEIEHQQIGTLKETKGTLDLDLGYSKVTVQGGQVVEIESGTWQIFPN